MTPSKKDKLIRCLKKLQIKQLDSLIQAIQKKDLLNDADFVSIPYKSDPNAALTEVAYKYVWKPHHKAIMANPNSEVFKEFCLNDIGPIKPSSILNFTSKFKR